jgi:hypothetical protein
MSDQAISSRVRSEAAAMAILARLTRKGARLVPTLDGYAVHYPGERVIKHATKHRCLASADVQPCVEREWLHADRDGVLRLTEAGALALRRGGAAPDVPKPAMSVDRPRISVPRTTVRSGGPGVLARMSMLRDGTGKPLVSSGQREAGERLAGDFVRGQMTPRITANWDRAALGTAGARQAGAFAADLSDGVAAAQERVRQAMRYVGPEFADLLLDVCCLDLRLEAIEKQRGWPPRSGRIVLGLALDCLTRHYGIVTTGPQRGQLGAHHAPSPA